jgi:hypothetical protein
MYFAKAKALTGVLFFIYWYIKSKEKAPLLIILILSHIAICTIIFKFLFPGTPFVSPTIEYLVYLAIVGIPFLISVYKIGMEFDRMPTEKRRQLFNYVFEATRPNIIFWTILVLLNLLAYIMDNTK